MPSSNEYLDTGARALVGPVACSSAPGNWHKAYSRICIVFAHTWYDFRIGRRSRAVYCPLVQRESIRRCYRLCLYSRRERLRSPFRAFAGLVFLQHAVHAVPKAQPIDIGKNSSAVESACDVALVSAFGAAESKLNGAAHAGGGWCGRLPKRLWP